MAKALNVNVAVTADTSQAKASLQSLQQTLTQLTSNSANLKIGVDTNQLATASKQVQELQAHLKAATNQQTGVLDYSKLSANLSMAGKSIDGYAQSLAKLGPQGRQAFNQLASAMAQSEVPAKRLTSLFGEFGTVVKNTVRWQAASSIIHGMMGSIQHAFSYAQQLNESLNRIQIVTGLSDEKMASFAENANKAAQKLSTTTTAYTDAALIYYQQGIRNQSEIAERVETTIKLANVSGQSAQKVSDQMTAIWNNFDNGTHSLEYYADVITALGAATASSSEEISTGLQKFASIADTVGLSYENATAALATITATTRQSADSVGTGLRTLFARLQSLKLGETLEDGVDLTKYTKALKTIGVDVLDAAGNMRQMDDILVDMGARWQTLTDAQKTATAQTVGGVRQYTTLMALMENFDFYEENVKIAKGSEGTVQQQADIYAQSWEAARDRVKAAAESIYSDLISDDFFIGLNNGFAKFLQIIDNIIDGVGGLKGVLTGVGAILTKVFSNQAAKGLYNFGATMKMLFTGSDKLKAQRAEEISNLALMGAGIDTKNPINVANLSPRQFENYQNLSAQLALQNRFAQNYDYMTEEEKYLARQSITNIENGRQAVMQQQDKISANRVQTSSMQSRLASEASRSNVFTNMPHYANNRAQLIQEGKITDQAYIDQLVADGYISKVTSANGSEKYFANTGEGFKQALQESFVEPMQEFQQKGNIFHEFLNGTADDLTSLSKTLKDNGFDKEAGLVDQLLGSEDPKAAVEDLFGTLQGELQGLTDADIANLSDVFGVDSEHLTEYVNALRQGVEDEDELLRLQHQLDQDIETANEATDPKNKNMNIAQGVVQLASGLQAAAAAGVALESVVDTISAIKEGTMSAGEGATQLASGLTNLGMMGIMAFNGLKAAATAFNLTALTNPILLAITAIAILLPTIIKAIDNAVETPKEKLARLQEEAEQAKTRADEAKEAYDNLLSSQSQHNELLNTLNELTEGTEEFRDALLEANEVAQGIIKLNNLQYGKDYYYDERGAIQFQEGVLDAAVSRAARERQETEQMATMAEAYARAQDLQVNHQDEINQLRAKMGELGTRKGAREWKDNLTEGEYNQIREQINQNGGKNYDDQFLFRYLGQQFENYDNWLKSGSTGSLADMMMQMGEGNFLFTADQMSNMMQAYFGQSFQEMYTSFGAASQATANAMATSLSNLLGQFSAGTGKTAAEQLVNNQVIEELTGKYGASPDALERLISSDDLARIEATKDNVAQLQTLYTDITEGLTTDSTNPDDIKAAIKQYLIKEALEDEFNARQKEYLKSLGQDFKDVEKLTGEQLEQLQVRTGEGGDLWNKFKAQQEAEYANSAAAMAAQYNRLTDQTLSSEDIFKNFNKKDLDLTKGITSKFESAYGKDLASTVSTQLINEVMAGTDRTLQSALSKIAITGDSIVDIKSIRKASKELGQETAETLEAGIREAKGGKKGLFEDLYKSEEFSDDLKKLQKQFKKTGRIGGKAIMELAEDSEYLVDWLDIAEVSATALSDILEALEANPDIGIEAITDELIEAMDAASGLENNLAKVFQYIDDFDQERSTRDIGKFYKGLSDSVQDAWESGQIMDPQALQAWGEMFGSESLANYRKFMAEVTNDENLTPQQISDKINAKFADEVAAMQSIQKYGDLSGMFEYYNKQGPVSSYKDAFGQSHKGESMFTYDSKTGQVVTAGGDKSADLYRKKGWDTTEGFVKGLMDNYGMSEQMARAMTAEYASTNAFLNQMFRTSDAELGLGLLFGQGKNSRIGYKNGEFTGAKEALTGTDHMVTAAEMDMFYSQYSDILDEMYDLHGTAEEKATAFRNKMRDLAGETGNAWIEMSEETKTAVKDAIKNGENAYKVLKDRFKGDTGMDLQDYLKEQSGRNEDGTWKSLDKAMGAYERLGYTAAEAYDLIQGEYEDWVANTEASSAAVAEHTKGWETAMSADEAAFATFVGASEGQWNRFNDWLAEKGLDGQITAENWADFLNADAANEAIQKQADIFAESFKNAFADLFTSLQWDEETHTFKIKPELEEPDTTPIDELEQEPVEVPVELTLEEQIDAAVEAKLAELQAELDGQLESVRSEAAQQLADALGQVDAAKAEADAAISQAQTEAKGEIAQAYLDAQKYVNDANKTIEEKQAAIEQLAADTAEAIEQAKAAAQSEVEALQTAAEGAAERASEAEAKALELQQQANEARQAADDAKAEAERIAKEAGESSQEAQDALARAQGLEDAANAAQEAADAAVAAAAAERGAAEAAAAAAEAAATAAASLVSDMMTDKGAEVRGALTGEGGNAAVAAGAEQYNDTQLGWLSAYAQYSAATHGGQVQNLDVFSWSDFAKNSGYTDVPSWFGSGAKGFFGLSDNVEENGVGNWSPSYFSNASDEWGGWNLDWLQGLADAATEAASSGPTAEEGLLEEIAQNTSDAAEAAEDSNDTATNSDTVVNNSPQGKVALTSEQRNIVAQNAGVSTTTVDMVQVLKNAGVTSDNYKMNGELDWANLPSEIQSAISKGMDEAGVSEDAEMPNKSTFDRVSKEIDAQGTVELEAEIENPEEIPEQAQQAADAGGPIEEEVTLVTGDSDSLEADDQTATVNYETGEQAEPEDQTAGVEYEKTGQEDPSNSTAGVYYTYSGQDAPQPMETTLTVHVVYDDPKGMMPASGYNNANTGGYFAGGKHSNGQYRGLATVGELGPELMIHRGQPFLVGVSGRTTAYIEPDDEIYTAAETQKIMEENPTMRDIPGFSVGYNRISWGSKASGASKGGGGKSGSKSKDFDPERYHYISQQIANINRYMERMNKLKDHAYGSHRVRAINNEIDATKKLIDANEILLDEAQKYLETDKKAIEGLGVKFDKNGEITNWDEMQEQYARKAAESDDEGTRDAAKKNWKLIQQYEETLKKIHDTEEELDDLRWSISDLINEQIEAKVEVKIDMDDRELELLDYYLNKIQDNIYKTADAFDLVNGKLNVYNDEISTYKGVMDDLLKNATNAQGDEIKGLSLSKWLAMTPQERDALDIDGDLGKKLEEYSASILDTMQKIQEMKMYAVDALAKAFEELNTKVTNSIDIFGHYGSLLETLRDLSDLQGMTMNKEMKSAIEALNNSMIANTKNNIKSQQEYYAELVANAEALKQQIATTQDWEVKQALQEQLEGIEDLMRNTQENLLSLWQDGLSKLQEMFKTAIDNALKEYEKSISGVYSNIDNLKEAYERQNTINHEYVDDYERMYQLSKLQRNINKDLDNAAVNGNRHNKNLKALLAEIEAIQASGQEMSEYDLTLLEKKYEYEKALADLEDLRNAKQTVRLQRDRNGNWGYVYTATDNEDLAKKEQEVEDKLHEWQQFEMESIEDFSSQLFDLQTEYGKKLAAIMNQTWDSDEDRDNAITRLDDWYNERLTYLNKYLDTAFSDANSTIERAKERYKTTEFEIVDSLSETTLGMVNNAIGTTQELIANLQTAMENMKTAAMTALEDYSNAIVEFNILVEQSNEMFAAYANGQASSITKLSDEQLNIVHDNIENMAETLRTGNDAMLAEVQQFNEDYYNKFYGPKGVITTNEKFLNQLQTALEYLNRIDYAIDGQSTINTQTNIIKGMSSTRTNAEATTRFDTGGYTGSWGPDGRYAMLHEKEQVFNAEDTVNLLEAANILRTLDLQAGFLAHGLGEIFDPSSIKNLGQTIEQQVTITAEFPNATNHSEIEEAFNNLANRATQYANRKVG